MSQPLMQACLWHGLSLGLPQRRLDHVMAGRLFYKSILGERRLEKLRSVHMAWSIASATSKAIAQGRLGGSPNTQPDGPCGGGPLCPAGVVELQQDSCLA